MKKRIFAALSPPCVLGDSVHEKTAATVKSRVAFDAGGVASTSYSTVNTTSNKVAEKVLASQIIRTTRAINDDEEDKRNVYVLHGLMGQGKNWRGPITMLSEKLRESLPKTAFSLSLD